MDTHWFSIVHDLYKINNFMPVLQAQFLYEQARNLPDKSIILEVGSYHGLSTCALAYGCLGTNKHIYTIDTFIGNPLWTNDQDGECYYEQFRQNVAERNLTTYITALKGRSEEFYTWNQPLQLLFIDGNHELMMEDIAAFYPHLVQGGMLLLHDVYEPEDERIPFRMNIHYYNLAWGIK